MMFLDESRGREIWKLALGCDSSAPAAACPRCSVFSGQEMYVLKLGCVHCQDYGSAMDALPKDFGELCNSVGIKVNNYSAWLEVVVTACSKLTISHL